jgi:hypothetical protein
LNAAELFESSLALIDGVTATACRRARLKPADAEDFARDRSPSDQDRAELIGAHNTPEGLTN